MANLLQFKASDFRHLSKDDENLVKSLVYRLDFQEAVLKMRSENNLPAHPVLRKSEKPVIEHWDYLDRDVHSTIVALGYETYIWAEFCYLFVKYGLVTRPNLAPHIEAFNAKKEKELTQIIQNIIDSCEGDELCIAKEISNKLKSQIYYSTKVSAELDGWNISMRISSDATKEDVVAAYRAASPYLKFFGREKNSYPANLDAMNVAVSMWREKENRNPNKIAVKLREMGLGSFSADVVRQLISRGKKRGF